MWFFFILFFIFNVFVYGYLVHYFFPIDEAHADAVDIGVTSKLVPVRPNLLELDVVAIITNVSNEYNIVVNVSFVLFYFLYFILFFLFLLRLVIFIFEVLNHFFNVFN